MLQRLTVGVAILMGGCLETNTTRCGDLVCASGAVCYEPLTACVRPAQIEACNGLDEDAPCPLEGAASGRCVQGVCAAAGCGNSEIEIGEVCDDGNTVSGDGCSSDCRSMETCGNSIVDVATGEACDDGNTDPMDGCQANCELPTCGDGFLDTGEECDDGNNANADGCNARCTSKETCQNGIVDPQKNEDCDDSNNIGGDGCSMICKFEICGNAFTDVGEVCDDGNNVSGDDCAANCKSNETCGNGIPDLLASPTPETCDEGGNNSSSPNATCRPDCQQRTCGDGIIDNIFGESCEPGVAITNATCGSFGYYGGTLGCTSGCAFDSSTCIGKCGDGIVQAGNGEECDGTVFPNNETCVMFGYYSPPSEKPACTSICKISTASCSGGRCGDSTRQSVELCEGTDLNGTDCTDLGYYLDAGLACNAACSFDTTSCSGGRCGDNVRNGPEFCDGNVPAGSTCADFGQDLGRVSCSSFCAPGFYPDCSRRGFGADASPASVQLRDVWAASADEMFVVGDSGTILHYDGVGWQPMVSGTTAILYSVWGTSPTNVYAIGQAGLVLRYNGTTWSQQSIPSTTVALTGIDGVSASEIYVVGGNSPNATVLVWNGVAWAKSTFGSGVSLNDVYAAEPGVAYAVGYAGTIQRLMGGSWSPMTAATNTSFTSVWGRSATEVYAGGATGTGGAGPTIQRYDGNSWSVESNLSSNVYMSTVFGRGTETYAVTAGNGTVTVLRRGPLYWETIDTSSLYTYWGGAITPAGELVLVGSSGTITRAPVWTRPLFPPSLTAGFTMNDVWATEENEAFIVGSNGIIRRKHQDATITSGWTTMTSNTTATLYGVWGASPTRVFAVGSGGTIRVWDGVGTNWATMTTNPATTGTFTEVWGSSATDVFAAMSNGAVYHYDGNASSEWTVSKPAGGNGLYGISGSGPNDVYAVGFAGVIYRYNGSTWTSVASGQGFVDHNDVVVRSPGDVIAVGSGGQIVRSTDFGASWKRMTGNTTRTLMGVAARGAQGSVVAVGFSGELLHFDDERWTTIRPVVAEETWAVALTADHMFVTTTVAGGRGAYEMHHNLGTVERCGNEWDDDADGAHDCADSDCAGSAYCSDGGACQVAGTIACAATVQGDNFTGSPFPDDYQCGRALVGPDASYRFTAPSNGSVTATLTNFTGDLDLVVVEEYATGGCNATNACVAAVTTSTSTQQVTFTAVAGRAYQIVVDGFAGAASPFQLSLACP